MDLPEIRGIYVKSYVAEDKGFISPMRVPAPKKGNLKMTIDPIMLLKTNIEKFRHRAIPSYP
jgi:hypothetical protein